MLKRIEELETKNRLNDLLVSSRPSEDFFFESKKTASGTRLETTRWEGKKTKPAMSQEKQKQSTGGRVGGSKFKMVVFVSSIQDGGLFIEERILQNLDVVEKTHRWKVASGTIAKVAPRSFFRNVGWKIRAPWILKRYPSSSSVEKSLWILSKNDWKEGLRPGNPCRRFMIVYTNM